jgi:hypothetical protein
MGGGQGKLVSFAVIKAADSDKFRLVCQVSHNPFLLSEGINVHPDASPDEALRERAWRVVEPWYLARLAALVEEFGTANLKGLGSDEPPFIAEAAVAGRVATVLIEAERHVVGKVDWASGQITVDELPHPEIDDVLNDLGGLVLSKGGQVVIVPAERMPTQTESWSSIGSKRAARRSGWPKKERASVRRRDSVTNSRTENHQCNARNFSLPEYSSVECQSW